MTDLDHPHGYRGIAPTRTTFTILWPHDGARQLEVVVGADLPAFGPLETRIRGIASIASSHLGLRMLLESALAGSWNVREFETVGGVTTVHLVPRVGSSRPGAE